MFSFLFFSFLFFYYRLPSPTEQSIPPPSPSRRVRPGVPQGWQSQAEGGGGEGYRIGLLPMALDAGQTRRSKVIGPVSGGCDVEKGQRRQRDAGYNT